MNICTRRQHCGPQLGAAGQGCCAHPRHRGRRGWGARWDGRGGGVGGQAVAVCIWCCPRGVLSDAHSRCHVCACCQRQRWSEARRRKAAQSASAGCGVKAGAKVAVKAGASLTEDGGDGGCQAARDVWGCQASCGGGCGQAYLSGGVWSYVRCGGGRNQACSGGERRQASSIGRKLAGGHWRLCQRWRPQPRGVPARLTVWGCNLSRPPRPRGRRHL